MHMIVDLYSLSPQQMLESLDFITFWYHNAKADTYILINESVL
jgi:hypothetical protein